MISEKIINDETKYVKDAIYSILKECNINFDNIKLFFQNDLNLPNRIFCVRKENRCLLTFFDQSCNCS